ncbi:MAG: hypothetical protein CMJ11_07990 [Pelagibacterales bacterium]|nr:hypothetical protein [Pelagibacterales bacterium]|tara:strand:- start:558 stop:1079 length:522 start_codon:yes stop_codon:yes gene_type:complete
MIIFNRVYLFLFLVFFIILSGCVDKKSSVYNPEEVGIIMETTPGVIVASRQIVIAGLKKDTQYWGAAIGATLAGATTYGLTGGDNVLEEAAIIISVIGGAMAGTALEEMRNKSDGVEYTININCENVSSTCSNASDTIVIVQAISDESDIISDGSNINIVRSNDGYVRVVSAK